METPQQIILRLKAAGLSQSRIARDIGTTQATISRIQSGEVKDPGVMLADKLRAYSKSIPSAA